MAGQLQLSSTANYQDRKENRTWGIDKRTYWILKLLLRSSTSTPKKHFLSQTRHVTKSAINRVGKYHPLPGRERVFVNSTIESCIVDLSTMTPHFYFQSSDHSALSFYFFKRFVLSSLNRQCAAGEQGGVCHLSPTVPRRVLCSYDSQCMSCEFHVTFSTARPGSRLMNLTSMRKLGLFPLERHTALFSDNFFFFTPCVSLGIWA